MKTILIYGLPGSGKTTFAKKLKDLFGDRAIHFNGDEFRKTYNDWDFSEEGRRRQAERMRNAALNAHNEGKYAILDFVCPKTEYRKLINADYEIYMNIEPVRDFPDTTALFEKPDSAEEPFVWEINSYEESDKSVKEIFDLVMIDEFNYNAPTALMIGRFQPFHAGHKALFLKALEKHGQVCIAVRDMPQDEKNPFTAYEVLRNIRNELIEYAGKFDLIILPNIVDVVYGRDVGWTVSKIDLPPEVEAISATQIRKDMGISYQYPVQNDAPINYGNLKENKPKIYESPDGGKTIYEREFGSKERTLVNSTNAKNSVQQQWNIVYSHEC